MKILIVSQYFHPENFRINDLAVGMVERGHSVTVLTGIPNYPDGRYFAGYGLFRNRREDYHGVEIIRAPLVSRGSARGFRLVVNYLSFALCACFTGLFRVRGRYDAIFVFEVSPITVGIPAIFMKWLKQAPILFWVLDLWPETLAAVGAVKSERGLALVGQLVRFIYRHCDRVLVQSCAFIPAVAKMGVPVENIDYFPSWGETLYQPMDKRQAEQGLPPLPQGFRVLFAGNIGISQDFESVLAAAEKLAGKWGDIHWLVVGDGRQFSWLQEQIRVRGLEQHVHLLGRYPLEKMPAFLAAADALLVSLKRDPIFALTIPAKIQSYLACAKPVLAMLDGEGARIVQESGAGLVCPAENADALADIVEKMYRQSEGERTCMGQAGRRYYEMHFDRATLFSRLAAWMQEL